MKKLRKMPTAWQAMGNQETTSHGNSGFLNFITKIFRRKRQSQPELNATKTTSKSIVPFARSLKPVENSHLPIIQTAGRNLRDISKDTLNAIETTNNPPKIFTRSGKIVRLECDENQHLSIGIFDENSFLGIMARSADFVGVTGKPVLPPRSVAKDILSLPYYSFHPLIGIVTTPVLRPDGSVLSEPGYDRDTRLYLAPDPDLKFDEIPNIPTSEQIKKPKELLEEIFADFPFDDEASRANALGLIITPIVRPSVKGMVPLALVDATQAGTGKTLLCEIVSTTSVGYIQNMTALPNSEGELRKKLTSILMGSPSIIIFDNIDKRLDSGVLSLALTNPQWSDRILGRSEIIETPQRATWIVNGNNIQLGGDIPRRCYKIKLNAEMSRPWKRNKFKHQDLIKWVIENRGAIIRAILILARAWFVAGKPAFKDPVIGGFTEWVQVVGGILNNAGISQFLGNINHMYETADDEGIEWESFLSCLHVRFCNQAVPVREIIKRIEEDAHLRDLLPSAFGYPLDATGKCNENFPRLLGQALKRVEGKFHGDGNFRVEKGIEDKHNGVQRWRFRCGVCGVCGDHFSPEKNT